MNFKIGDIVRIEEPDWMPMFWNREYKIIELKEVIDAEESIWMIIEVMGDTIKHPWKQEIREIKQISVTTEGQKDLILVKRMEEIIPKHIKKLKI